MLVTARQVKSVAKQFALFGVESVFAADFAETVERLGYKIALAIVDGEPEWDLAGFEPKRIEDCGAADMRLPCGIPWVTPGLKWKKVRRAVDCGFHNFPNLADPHSSVARSAVVDRGVFLGAGATMGAFAAAGEFALLNRHASLGHHSQLGSYASLGPGAIVAARCSIGSGTMVGAGAIVTPGISIGANCLVSAGAVVSRDMPDHVMCAGNPARVIKTDYPGYKGALVL
jgi:acyl-[acyl carrier protein]--UDP-N-acetylglucosamine O-acyltransferase